MSEFSYLNNANPDYIDNLYSDYCNDPSSVDTQWADFLKAMIFPMPQRTALIRH